MDTENITITGRELCSVLESALKDGGSFSLRVTGWSMRPLLRHGRDSVWLRAFDPKRCRRGTLLLFQELDGHIVLHRVRKCLPDGYLMNGDAQVHCERIAASQVLAEAFMLCRAGKQIDCNSPKIRLWNIIWFPTRPFRPVLFRIGHIIKTIFHR